MSRDAQPLPSSERGAPQGPAVTAPPSPDSAGGVLRQLYEGPHLLVPRRPLRDDPRVLDPWLEHLASSQRQHLGPAPPSLDLPIARQATYSVAETCRMLAYGCARGDVAALAAAALPPSRADAASAAAHYSADLAWRFLPDLWELARSHAPPLLEALASIGAAWPLSSVGAPLSECPEPGAWFAHPCLRRLYLDRIFRRQAWDRLAAAQAARAFAADLGSRPELAPGAASYLKGLEHAYE